jgi:hypothetical protein
MLWNRDTDIFGGQKMIDKNTKWLFYLIALIVAMLLPMSVCAANTTLLEDTFDSWPNGYTPVSTDGYTLDMKTGCSATADGGRLKIVSAQDTVTSNRAFVTRKLDSAITSGQFMVEYSIEVNSIFYAINGFPLLTDGATDATGSAKLYISSPAQSYTKAYDGTTQRTLANTSWTQNQQYKVRLIVNLDTKTYEVWIDSGEGYTQCQSTDATPISTFNFNVNDTSVNYIRFLVNHPTTVAANAIYYIDNLKVTSIDANSGGTSGLEPKDHAVMVSAVAQENPSKITLSWPQNTKNTYYNISRKSKTSTSWGSVLAAFDSTATGYVDSNVTVGEQYEYQIMTNNGSSYILSGIKVPAVENRGKLILIVDKTYTAHLKNDLKILQEDLVGDGWTVIRHDVLPTDTPAQVKALIQADYNADPVNVKSVFLFGHIPIRQSGSMAPDGHEARTWPADVYYGDMDGVWSDSSTSLPSDVELQVGRVDMWNLPAFYNTGGGEMDLLRRYLEKAHKYRHGLMNLQQRGLIHDAFGEFNGEAFARNGWNNFPQLLGGANTAVAATWKLTLPNDDYLWSYICGSGSNTTIDTTALTTADLAANSYKTAFGMTFGSFLGEWDQEDNLLRSFLAMKDYGLTNVWAGRPNWFFHHMGLGENIGYSARLTQNNSSLYSNAGSSPRMVHIALMGDPTLRLYPVMPPSAVRVMKNNEGNNEVVWNASGQAVLGYYVYRATDRLGTYERISNDLVTVNNFIDTQPLSQSCTYMVRAVVLGSSASGTFYNLSQGIMADVTVNQEGGSNGIVSADVLVESKQISVSGTVDSGEGAYVTVKIIDPLGDISYIDQIIAGQAGAFNVIFPTRYARNGVYSVYVSDTLSHSKMSTSFIVSMFDDMQAGAFEFIQGNGQPLLGLTARSDVKVKCTVSNYSGGAINPKLMLALYDNNGSLKLLKQVVISTDESWSEATKTLEVGFKLPDDVNGYILKAFMFERLENIQSVCEPGVFIAN